MIDQKKSNEIFLTSQELKYCRSKIVKTFAKYGLLSIVAGAFITMIAIFLPQYFSTAPLWWKLIAVTMTWIVLPLFGIKSFLPLSYHIEIQINFVEGTFNMVELQKRHLRQSSGTLIEEALYWENRENCTYLYFRNNKKISFGRNLFLLLPDLVAKSRIPLKESGGKIDRNSFLLRSSTAPNNDLLRTPVLNPSEQTNDLLQPSSEETEDKP